MERNRFFPPLIGPWNEARERASEATSLQIYEKPTLVERSLLLIRKRAHERCLIPVPEEGVRASFPGVPV